jgi:hypothetical protein
MQMDVVVFVYQSIYDLQLLGQCCGILIVRCSVHSGGGVLFVIIAGRLYIGNLVGGVSSIRGRLKYRIKYDILLYCILVIDLIIFLCFIVDVKSL